MLGKLCRTLLLVSACTCPLAAWSSETAGTPPLAGVATSAEVNLNTADRDTLMSRLVGIGASKADAIITYREAHGAFVSVDELLEVKGIGPAILERNRERLVTE